MRILHLTDLHSHYQFLYKVIDESQPDLIVLSGDITHFGGEEDIEGLWQEMEHFPNVKIFAALGNCDPPSEIIQAFDGTQINYIGFKVTALNEHAVIVGVDGGLKSGFGTVNEYDEFEYQEFVEKVQADPLWKKSEFKIVVSHNPPFGLLDEVHGRHQGSRSLLKLAQEANLYFCGHIHEQRNYEKIAHGYIANPGPFRVHNYGVIDYQSPDKIKIELKNVLL